MTATLTFPSELDVREREPMSQHTSLRVGGPADYWVEVRTVPRLTLALTTAQRLGLPRTLMGHGTNVLVADEGIEGLVICNRCAGFEPDPKAGVVRVESGHSMARLAGRAARAGLAGLGFAIGLPGTVGGAVFGNAGAFGGDVASVLDSARVWYPDGVRVASPQALDLSYRHSALQDDPRRPVVLEARFRVTPGDPAKLRAELVELARRRREAQPRGMSAGSFFRNPAGDHAGRLIEAAGLKDARRGGAVVSARHANFLANAGGASAADVLALARHVQTTVQARFRVRLRPEVRLLGRWGPAARELCA